LNNEDFTKNLKENKGLADALGWTEDIKVDGGFVKEGVKRLFYEIDQDHQKLQEINNKILNNIKSIEEVSRSEH